MKKIILSSFLLITCYSVSFGQKVQEPITMKKVFGGYQFYQGDQRLNVGQLVNIMEPNEEAYKQMKAAKGTYTWATIFGTAGGVLIGFPLGTAIAGGDPNWTLAGIGAGLVVISIPISGKFNKQAKSAVDSYNNSLGLSSKPDTSWKFAITGNGVGITFRF